MVLILQTAPGQKFEMFCEARVKRLCSFRRLQREYRLCPFKLFEAACIEQTFRYIILLPVSIKTFPDDYLEINLTYKASFAIQSSEALESRIWTSWGRFTMELMQ